MPRMHLIVNVAVRAAAGGCEALISVVAHAVHRPFETGAQNYVCSSQATAAA